MAEQRSAKGHSAGQGARSTQGSRSPSTRRARAVLRVGSPEQLALPWAAEAMLLAGVDEAGRGPLAGPVVAAAVILDPASPIEGLRDSKVLSAARRERLFDEIRARALCCAIGLASSQEIDQLNILQATLLAMQRAVAGLRLRPQQVLVDGNRLPILDVPAEAVVKGDSKVPAISAASILAKVHRDRLCDELHTLYPGYGFDAHRGYPTPEHLSALQRLGPCPEHRRSFAPVRECIDADRIVSP